MRKALLAVASLGAALVLVGAGCQTVEKPETINTPPENVMTPATTTAEQLSDFTISVEAKGNGTVKVNFTTPTDVNQANLFRIAYGPTEHPTIPSSRWYARSSNKLRDATITGITPGITYFRICEWSGNSCANYSNEVSVDVK